MRNPSRYMKAAGWALVAAGISLMAASYIAGWTGKNAVLLAVLLSVISGALLYVLGVKNDGTS